MADEDDKKPDEKEDKKPKDDPKDADAEGEDGEDDEGDEKSSKGSPNKLIIIAGAALLLLLIIGGVLFFLLGGSEEVDDTGTAATEGAEAVPPSTFKNLEPLTINLLTDRGARFLKVSLTLEIEGAVDEITWLSVLPKIQDDLNTFLRQLRPDDFKGTANIYKLKEDLLLRTSQSAHPLLVKNVLFRELIVQ